MGIQRCVHHLHTLLDKQAATNGASVLPPPTAQTLERVRVVVTVMVMVKGNATTVRRLTKKCALIVNAL